METAGPRVSPDRFVVAKMLRLFGLFLLRCCEYFPAGQLEAAVEDFKQNLPPATITASSSSGSSSSSALTFVAELATYLTTTFDGSAKSKELSATWQAAKTRMHAQGHLLPLELQQPLRELLSVDLPAESSSSISSSKQQQQIERLQQQIEGFLIALDGQLARESARAAAAEGAGVPTWVDAGKEWNNAPSLSKAEGAGLEELVGGREAAAMSARGRRRKQRGEVGEDGKEQQQPYEILAQIHHDQGIQRYLTVSVRRGDYSCVSRMAPRLCWR